MGSYNCPHGYRDGRTGNLRCALVERENYCLHQYLCPSSRRFEYTGGAQSCRVKQRGPAEGEKKGKKEAGGKKKSGGGKKQ